MASAVIRSSGSTLAAEIARDIERGVARAGWPVGLVLADEADLLSRYGVNRSVLREALRIVEHHQVATMLPGPSGGLVVRAPDARIAAAPMVVYLEYVGTTVMDLLHARLVLEPLAAALAAETVTAEAVARLRTALAAERDAVGTEDVDGAHDLVHVTIADLSGNVALRLLIEVLTWLTTRFMTLPQPGSAEDAAAQDATLAAHVAMVEAIAAGDAGLARHRAAAHVRGLAAWSAGPAGRAAGRPGRPSPHPDHHPLVVGRPAKELAGYPPTHAEVIAGSRPAGSASGGSAGQLPDLPDPDDAEHAGLPAEGALAEVVATRIRVDIARRGWPVGEVVGSEADLLARHRVSRPVLGEALRLLERLSVATMRPGPRGGLTVTAPDAAASAEMMALYLDFCRTDVHRLREIRAAVEQGCVARVAAQASDPIVAHRLRAALLVHEDTPLDEVRDLGHTLHTELARLSGNPVLELILRIITTLSSRHSDEPPDLPPEPSREVACAMARAHTAIADAVLAGDESLARHRMARHLESLDAWWH